MYIVRLKETGDIAAIIDAANKFHLFEVMDEFAPP